MTAENEAIDPDVAMSQRFREWVNKHAVMLGMTGICGFLLLGYLIWVVHNVSVNQDPQHIKEVEQQAIATRQADAKMFDEGVLRSITYLRDPATGFCFAHYQVIGSDMSVYRNDPRSITRVECTKEVLDLIAKRHSGRL